MKQKYIFSALALILLNLKVSSQELNVSQRRKSSPLTYAQQEIFHSEVLKENQKINIYLPESFQDASNEHTYPVLLLLEDEFFHMVSGVIRHLSSVERMPETIVISILDMSYIPTVYTNGSTFWPGEQLSGENPDPFTKYLKEELFPYLKSNYRANDFRIVMGLSATSIYTLHAFVKEPELFNAHIAIAAGDILGMGYHQDERFIDLIADEVKGLQGKKRFLYVTSSDSDGGGKSPEIGENLEELDQMIASYRSESFRFISRIFPNEGHYDVALPALLEAIELIFPKKDWFARYRDIVGQPGNALENIDDYYRQLSKKYDFTILPRAERWNSVNRLSWIGPYILRQGRVTEGIEIIKRWVEYRPKSTLALSELAQAYEESNQLEKAITTMTEAYNLSVEFDMQNSEQYLRRLADMKKSVSKE